HPSAVGARGPCSVDADPEGPAEAVDLVPPAARRRRFLRGRSRDRAGLRADGRAAHRAPDPLSRQRLGHREPRLPPHDRVRGRAAAGAAAGGAGRSLRRRDAAARYETVSFAVACPVPPAPVAVSSSATDCFEPRRSAARTDLGSLTERLLMTPAPSV